MQENDIPYQIISDETVPAVDATASELPEAQDTAVDARAFLTEVFENAHYLTTDDSLNSLYEFVPMQDIFADILSGDWEFSEPYIMYDFTTQQPSQRNGENLYKIIATKGDFHLSILASRNTNYLNISDADWEMNAIESGQDFVFGTSMEYGNGYYASESGLYSGEQDAFYDFAWNEIPNHVVLPVETDVTVKEEVSTTTTVAAIAGKDGILYGDANMDGNLDLSDAILLNKVVTGSVQVTDQQISTLDCDGNGTISGADGITLLRFLMHLEASLPTA